MKILQQTYTQNFTGIPSNIIQCPTRRLLTKKQKIKMIYFKEITMVQMSITIKIKIKQRKS